jgi:hypothetical protein
MALATADNFNGSRGYVSARARAWRNTMAAAINAGLKRGLFTLEDKKNLWPGWSSDPNKRDDGCVFPFEVKGIPAFGYVHDIGWDELSLHAALWPSADGERWVRCPNAGFLAGDVFAEGRLERRTGLYLERPSRFSAGVFRARRNLAARIALLCIEPDGYAVRGG